MQQPLSIGKLDRESERHSLLHAVFQRAKLSSWDLHGFTSQPTLSQFKNRNIRGSKSFMWFSNVVRWILKHQNCDRVVGRYHKKLMRTSTSCQVPILTRPVVMANILLGQHFFATTGEEYFKIFYVFFWFRRLPIGLRMFRNPAKRNQFHGDFFLAQLSV